MTARRTVSAAWLLIALLLVPSCGVSKKREPPAGGWVAAVCAAQARYLEATLELPQTLQQVLANPQQRNPTSFAAALQIMDSAGKDLLAEMRAVELRVPKGDRPLFEWLYNLYRTVTVQYRAVADTIQSATGLADALDLGQVEEAKRQLDTGAGIAGRLGGTLKGGVPPEVWRDLDPATVEAFGACSLPTPPSPPSTQPLGPAAAPWALAVAADAPPSARTLDDLMVNPRDLVGIWKVEADVGIPEDHWLDRVLHLTFEACSLTSPPPRPIRDMPAPQAWREGSIARPDGEVPPSLGQLHIIVEQYATPDDAAVVEGEARFLGEVCGGSGPGTVVPDPLPNVVLNLSPQAKVDPRSTGLIPPDFLGEQTSGVPIQGTTLIVLRRGPLVAAVITDPFGVAAPTMRPVVELLSMRLSALSGG